MNKRLLCISFQSILKNVVYFISSESLPGGVACITSPALSIFPMYTILQASLQLLIVVPFFIKVFNFFSEHFNDFIFWLIIFFKYLVCEILRSLSTFHTFLFLPGANSVPNLPLFSIKFVKTRMNTWYRFWCFEKRLKFWNNGNHKLFLCDSCLFILLNLCMNILFKLLVYDRAHNDYIANLLTDITNPRTIREFIWIFKRREISFYIKMILRKSDNIWNP